MCLARLYPDFETLAADGQLEKLAELVYGPLLQWVAHQVQTRPHEDAREMEVTAA
jgi:exodeoxyribonuclease V gamma subunit